LIHKCQRAQEDRLINYKVLNTLTTVTRGLFLIVGPMSSNSRHCTAQTSILFIYIHNTNNNHIAHPHLLMRTTSEWFLPTWPTFKDRLVNENPWMQRVLVLTVH
jgi:hypothetical protein